MSVDRIARIGRYQILGELGRGAMGVVYRAHDPNIGREVAIKTIHLDMQEGEAVERFRREAKAAGNLSHPNIVTIYDAGEDNGVFYIAMELLNGETLQQILAKGGMKIGEMIRIMEQVSAALDYAHARHVVHRDVKPANVMISGGHVKVMDFGLAKITSTMATATNRVVGTPSYMSPEQIMGGTIDGRSDVFSLGAMLYEMLAGTRPFRGDNIAVVMFQIMKEDPKPLTEVNPSIPAGLNAVVTRALAKEPIGRYQTCGQLVEDLRNFEALGATEVGKAVKASGAVAARPAVSGGKRASSEALAKTIVAAAAPGSDRLKQSLQEQWKALTLAGAGVVLLLIVGVGYWRIGTGPGTAGENELVAPAVIETAPAGEPESAGEQPPAGESGSPVTNPSPGGLSVEPAARPPAAQPPAPAPRRPRAQQAPPREATRPAAPAATPPAAAPPAARPPAESAASAPAAPATAAVGVGRVSLHTEPQGARIFVDGQETSYRTPVNFGLAPGTYQVRVERPGYDSQTKQIVVRQNETVTEQFELQRNGEGRSLIPFR